MSRSAGGTCAEQQETVPIGEERLKSDPRRHSHRKLSDCAGYARSGDFLAFSKFSTRPGMEKAAAFRPDLVRTLMTKPPCVLGLNLLVRCQEAVHNGKGVRLSASVYANGSGRPNSNPPHNGSVAAN
jgi:hypothetical protein